MAEQVQTYLRRCASPRCRSAGRQVQRGAGASDRPGQGPLWAGASCSCRQDTGPDGDGETEGAGCRGWRRWWTLLPEAPGTRGPVCVRMTRTWLTFEDRLAFSWVCSTISFFSPSRVFLRLFSSGWARVVVFSALRLCTDTSKQITSAVSAVAAVTSPSLLAENSSWRVFLTNKVPQSPRRTLVSCSGSLCPSLCTSKICTQTL